MPKLMKLREVREALQVSANTLYRWRRDGKIRFTKVGARNYITADELERFIFALANGEFDNIPGVPGEDSAQCE